MMASTSLRISVTVQCTISNKEPFVAGNSRSTLSNSFRPLQAAPPRSTVLCFSSRRRGERATPRVSPKKINKRKPTQKIVEENEDVDEDAFEALFQLLEEDLKNDELNGNEDGDDDDISEEELAKLEQELAEALAGDDELFGAFESVAIGETKNDDGEKEDDDEGDDDDDHENEPEVGDEYDEDEEEEGPIKLKSWQLRRLGYALKNGRRKTSIKNLAADLCLDRAIVLKLLRDPPPNLVMLSASLPDKPVTTVLDSVEKPIEAVPSETTTEEEAARPQVEEKLPVHAMQSNWNARKRLKKVHLETLEQVYRRTKRPTNAMISSIVHVTNLPRKKVVKWFEDRRGEEGVPEERVPYKRATSESVFTS